VTKEHAELVNAKKQNSEPSRPDRADRWLVFVSGVVGPILFVVAFTVAGLVRPGYSPVHQAISDLSVGQNGSLMDTIAVVFGLLLIGFALGFARILRPLLGRGWLWLDSAFLILRGLAQITVAIFTEAPATVRIHSLASIVAITSLVAAFLVIGIGLRRNARWRKWGNYSLAACLATLVLAAIVFWVFTPGTPLAPAQLGGLMERLLYIETLAWYAAFGWRLFWGPVGN
jgi:hypothetical membrane protein